MNNKKIKILVLIGAICGLYLTAVFALFTFGGSSSGISNGGPFGSIKYSISNVYQVVYYIVNCSLLFVIYFFLYINKIKMVKVLSIILILSIFASLFWTINGVSVFMFAIFGAIMFGGIIPFVGIIPEILFFIGVFSPLFVFSKKYNTEILIASNSVINTPISSESTSTSI